MRFKKLIAAGASFLLVVGASTLGAAAAYADDGTTATDTAVTEPTPDPVVEPAPPAPEPVVETAPDPVVEPPTETTTDPVVEPSDEPVTSDTPSGESDSDPPADTSTDSSSSSSDSSDSSSSDSGSTSTLTTSGFSRTTSSLKTGFASSQPGGEPLVCTDLTDGQDGWTDKVDTVGDPATVEYTAPEGFLIDAYCVKAGTEPIIIEVDPPAESITIDHPNKDSVSHWQVHLIPIPDIEVVPAAQGTDETCDEQEAELVGGSIQLTLLAGVTYTITGPNGVVVPDGSGLADGLEPGSYDVSFVLDSGYTTNVSSPINIIIGAFDGDCGELDDIVVNPAAQGSDETCDEEESELVGGSIQLTVITGVTYTITGPNGNVPFDAATGFVDGLEPGQYDVSYVLDPGYTTLVDTPIVITIGAFDGDCGEDCNTARLASLNGADDDLCPLPDVQLCHATNANPNANNPYNPLTLPWQGAVGHAFPNPNDDHTGDIIPPFDYYENGVLKHFGGQNWPYGDPPTAEELVLWLAFFENGCADPDEVTPGAQATDESCELLLLVQGSVQVTVIAGVTYTVTGPNGVVPLDGSGNTGPVDPGQYSVAFTLDPGLTTSVISPIIVTVDAFDGDCDLVEHPIVTPAVVSSALSCLGTGSYTLSNDLSDPNAVEWTVNGSPLGLPLASPSNFTVTSPGVYNIHADPNAPDYGFPGGATTDWTLTFERPANCDLATLALTGQSPIAFMGGAMVLILAGLALFRLRSASQRKRPGII